MVTLIKQLIARGHAYEAGGEVLFDVQSMPDYGALSGRRLEEQKAGARVAVDAHKRNPADFVLWKLSSENEPGWDSPWGRGRPGWHIECSAMSAAYLGGPDGKDVFDIHGGGLDLIFPHHENAHDGELLDAQRLPAGRRREDVEEFGQLLHHQRIALRLARRSSALSNVDDPLPITNRLAGGEEC
jgi:cysteinyl-tRNA synthetase